MALPEMSLPAFVAKGLRALEKKVEALKEAGVVLFHIALDMNHSLFHVKSSSSQFM